MLILLACQTRRGHSPCDTASVSIVSKRERLLCVISVTKSICCALSPSSLLVIATFPCLLFCVCVCVYVLISPCVPSLCMHVKSGAFEACQSLLLRDLAHWEQEKSRGRVPCPPCPLLTHRAGGQLTRAAAACIAVESTVSHGLCFHCLKCKCKTLSSLKERRKTRLRSCTQNKPVVSDLSAAKGES